MIRTVHELTCALAANIAEAAVGRASELRIRICVAVTGREGNLSVFQRMDGAPSLSIHISQDKARTAASFGTSTRELFEMFSDNPSVREGLPHVPEFTFLGGGLPVKWHGEVIGAIGVSGGSEEQDIDCASAALQVLGQLEDH